MTERMPDWFAEALAHYPRLAITGGPRTGKTTLAKRVSERDVLHTDDLMALSWDAVPLEVMRRLAGKRRFVVEGVQAARALRKGLKVDAVVRLWVPRMSRTPGQETMARGERTVFEEWRRANLLVPVITGR